MVSGNTGPNACNVLESANVPVYLFGGGTVREAVEGCKAGGLESVAGANVQPASILAGLLHVWLLRE